MNAIASVILVAVLVFGSGCARKDWIEQTLVTVDVTGVWIGSVGVGNVAREIRLELEQQGPKVTGYVRRLGAGMGAYPLQLEGPLEGTVGGDVFSFRLTNAAGEGTMTVSGDEMKGYVSVGGRVPISMRRVESSSASPSQKQ